MSVGRRIWKIGSMDHLRILLLRKLIILITNSLINLELLSPILYCVNLKSSNLPREM